MHFRKEDLEKKQDELADELCVLLESAGRGGASSRKFEIPEYARRRIDISLSKEKLTGHFNSLVINDWKRKEHHEGDVPEERMGEHDILTGVALWLKRNGLRVYRDEDAQNIYVLGIERYEGIPVKGFEDGQLYALHASGHTDEAWHITSDGAPISSCAAEMDVENLSLTTSKGSIVNLAPLGMSEAEYVKEMKKRESGQKGGN